jgi:hypothetical protein
MPEHDETIIAKLFPWEVSLIREALDSHIYWQLSDEIYRDSGHVEDPGSDDPEKAEEIADAQKLLARLDTFTATAAGADDA